MYQPLTSLKGGVAQGRRAFTLIELLVVIAIIGILAGLLLPVLAGTMTKGRAISCLNLHRQVSLACLLYVDDFNDTMPYNLGEDEIRKMVAADRFINWNSTIMSWELDPDNTNTARVVQGGLGPYLSEAAQVLRCPSDRVVSDIQAKAGWSRRVRSISMNAMVGNAGGLSSTGANQNNPYYTQFFRVSQMPKPSEVFVFIEEHPDSINDAYFLNRFYSDRWLELPASWHGGAGNLTFGDGHAELHHWRDASTKPASLPDSAHLPFPVSAKERTDYDWLLSHTSVHSY